MSLALQNALVRGRKKPYLYIYICIYKCAYANIHTEKMEDNAMVEIGKRGFG